MNQDRSALLRGLTIAVIAAVVLAPIAWLALASVMTRGAILRGFPLPGELSWENFHGLARRVPLFDHLRGTAVLAGTSALAAVLIALPSAYYVSRGQGRYPRWLFSVSLSLWLVPPVALSLELYLWYVWIGWYDQLLGMVLLHSVLSAALLIFLLVAFLEVVPRSLDEVAWLDGLRGLAVVARVHGPLLGPAVVGFVALAFIQSWNEFLFASILTETRVRPISMDVLALTTGTRVDWGQLAALGVLSLTPLPLALLAVQALRLGYRRLGGQIKR